MLLSSDKVLDSVSFNGIVQDQAAALIARQPLIFYDRTPRTDADDSDIIATYTGKVYAADIIADDQEAVVYGGGTIQLAVNNIPNLKTGIRLSQALLSRLSRLRRGVADIGESELVGNWEQTTAEKLVLSVKQRINALICAMQMDAVTYDRFGIKITGSWGMPSDLKATPGTAWSDPASTPVTDILAIRDVGAQVYGENFNRVTLSRAAFLNALKTTEFKNLVSGFFQTTIPTTAFNAYQKELLAILSDRLDGMQIELHDTVYRTQSSAGTDATTRVQPTNKVILSSTADDNDPGTMDFANAIVTESVVTGLDEHSGIPGNQFGPIGYYTRRGDLNPPDVTAWGVARGFPRKFRPSATAVLTVG